MSMACTRSDRPAQGKRRRLPGRIWLAGLALCFAAATGMAQDPRIHRCIGANGEPTFSDRKCEPSREMPATDPAQPSSDSRMPLTAIAPAIARTCPRSAGDLRDRAAAAFAARSSVSLSGLFLWDGFGQGSAMAPLRELAALVAEPLVSIEIDSFASYPQDDTYDDEYGKRNDDLLELVIATVGEQERQVPYESIRRFEVVESAGCWWLLLPL